MQSQQTSHHELLAALAAAGVARVELAYDGQGDEGSVEQADFADTCGQPVELDEPLADRVIELAETLLADRFGCWMDNEGSAGQIRLDVPTGRLTIEHGYREVVFHDEDRVEIDLRASWEG